MRDAAGLAPPLAWLAVWNRHIQSDINEKRETAGEEDDAAVEHDGDEQDGDNDNEQEPERDRSGVLYGRIYSPVEEGQERDLLARRVGLAQGLIDFTRSDYACLNAICIR